MAMGFWQFPYRVWTAAPIGASGTLTSPALPVRALDAVLGCLIQVTSVAGAADVRLEYAIGDFTGTTFGSFDDEADLITSTATVFTTNPEGLHTREFALKPSPYLKLKVTELTGALTDTLVTLTMLGRE